MSCPHAKRSICWDWKSPKTTPSCLPFAREKMHLVENRLKERLRSVSESLVAASALASVSQTTPFGEMRCQCRASRGQSIIVVRPVDDPAVVYAHDRGSAHRDSKLS